MIPKVGTEITVKIRNPMADHRHLYADGVIAEHSIVSGTVYPLQKWQDPRKVFNLATGRPSFPFRTIDLDRVVTMNGKLAKKVERQVPQTRVWTVQGSKGAVYTLTEVAGKRSCTCPGFTFRSSCKHVLDP